MTIVAGLVHEGQCWVGADSMISDGTTCEESARPKLARRRGWVLGLAGSWSLLPLLRSLDVPRPTGRDSDGDELARAVKAAWGGRPGAAEVYVLAAGAGHIWVVQGQDWAALRTNHYCAIGTGEAVALGALHATGGLSPRARVMAALRAARQHCPSVGGRLRVVRV